MSLAWMMFAVSPSDFTNPDLPLSDKLAVGGEVALIGIFVVFSVLLILWGSLEFFHILFAAVSKRKKTVPTPVQIAQPVEAAADEGADGVDKSELVAAISAAVAVYTEKSPTSFRVVSFRRIHKKY